MNNHLSELFLSQLPSTLAAWQDIDPHLGIMRRIESHTQFILIYECF